MLMQRGMRRRWPVLAAALVAVLALCGVAAAGTDSGSEGVVAEGAPPPPPPPAEPPPPPPPPTEPPPPPPSLDIWKTADVETKREWGWKLRKDVNGEGWYLFEGDRGESKYTIEVERTGPTVVYRIRGTIKVHNPAYEKATIVAVVDKLEGVGYVPVTCSRREHSEWTETDDRMAFQTDGTVVFADGTAFAADGDAVVAEGLALASRHRDLPPAEIVLEPDASLYCWYGPVETTTRPTTNTAKVITRGSVKGSEVTIEIELKEEAEERMADRGLRIVDDYGTPKYAGDDLSWKLEDAPIAYKRWFSCADAGHVVNTARLVDKWGKVLAEDSADVHVACYGLEVKKDAYAAFDRTYRWWIDKWADPGRVELWNGAPSKGWDGKGWDPKGAEPACDPKDPKAPRGCDPAPCDPKDDKGKGCEPTSKATVDYKVKVWAEPYDSGHRAWGTIWIRNEHPKREAYVRDVRDLITGKYGAPITATVKCARPDYDDAAERKGGGDYRPSLRIPPGATVECSWYAKLPDGKDRWNTAYADLENHDFPAYGKPKDTGVTTFEGSAAVDFDKAKVEHVDGKVVVKDSLAGTLGTVWAKDAPAWFRYSLTFEPGKYAPVCGEGKVKNTAWFKTFDSGATGEASAYVSVRVWCPDPKKPDPPKGDPKDPPKGDPKPKDPPAPPKSDPPAPPKGDYDDDVICIGHGHKRGDRHDLAWKRLGEKGLKTPFFDTGLTYWQVLKLAKVDRRAYFKLARTYVVAKLWALGGAEASAEVGDALSWADGHFAGHGPNDQAARTVKAKRRVQRTMAEHGETLAEFAKSARKHCS